LSRVTVRWKCRVPFLRPPTRVFLDTSVLQPLFENGAFIFEDAPLVPSRRLSRMPDGVNQVESLRKVVAATRLAGVALVVSDASLVEVADRGRQDYLEWAEIARSWWEDEPGDDLFGEGPDASGFAFLAFQDSVGYLSDKDRQLVGDALDLGCEYFLTMETRLSRVARRVLDDTGLAIVRPTELWQLMRPWHVLVA